MKSSWRKHVIICLFLGLLAIPIYFLDLASTEESGGSNWITLDFRGLIFWTYINVGRRRYRLKFNCGPVISQVRGVAHSHGLNGTFRDPARRRGRRLWKSATGHYLESRANFDGESETSHQRH